MIGHVSIGSSFYHCISYCLEDNQYICVLHKDTKEQHIHIAANRIGFNGKAASDSNSYKRMASLCRSLEKQYQLKEVLSPRAFLSPKDRLLPRHDQRKEKLKEDIRQTLEKVTLYSAFEKQMTVLGYKVIKGRGISFIDDKKVKIKGSEVGFSLAKIEKILNLKQQLEIKKATQHQKQPDGNRPSITHSKAPLLHSARQHVEETAVEIIEKQLSGLLYQLLRPEYEADHVNPELIKEAKPKRNVHIRR